MKELIDGIIKYILDNNSYYNGGFTADRTEVKKIFPNDTLGNYFYIKIPDSINVRNSNHYAVNDCSTAAGVEMQSKLVAVIRGGNAYIATENIVATLQALQLRVTGLALNKEVVIDAEISDSEERKHAKARADGFTIISVNFVINYIFKPKDLKCLTSPCTC